MIVKKLAKIKEASLLIEKDILTFFITVNYEDGYSQNIGGISLDTYDNEKQCRIGTAYGCEMIRRLLLLLNVNDFSQMAGKMIWVHGEERNFVFDVKGLSSLRVDTEVENTPLFFKDVYKEFYIEN